MVVQQYTAKAASKRSYFLDCKDQSVSYNLRLRVAGLLEGRWAVWFDGILNGIKI